MLYRRGHFWWTSFHLYGKKYVRPTRQTSKAAASEYETRLRVELMDLAALGRTKEMLYGEAMDRYIETVLATKRRKPNGKLRRTSSNDLLRIKQLEDWFGRRASLVHVGKPAVVAEFNFALMKRMQPQSANRYLSLHRAILNKAYEWGALPVQPRVIMNAEAKPRNRYLTRDQEEQLIEMAPARLRDLVIFILDTGARREEALTLTWNNVDLERKPRGVVYFTDTKNGESRGVPLPRRTAKILRARWKGQGGKSLIVFSHPATRHLSNNRGEHYAFEGEMVPLSNWQILWRRLRENAGLGDVRLHDLRHTYASKLVRRGVPLYDVSKLLGHTTIKMTLRYAYLSVDELDAAVGVLDEATRGESRRKAAPSR